MQVRLIAYTADGPKRGLLPSATDINAAMPFNEIGSLTFTYPKVAPGVEHLSGYFEVAVELWNGSTWAEPRNARYAYRGRNDDLTEYAGEYRFSLQGYGTRLKKGIAWGQDSLNEDGKFVFSDASAGQVLKTLLDRNKALGWGPQFAYGFSSAVDSAGAAWTVSLPTYQVEPTMDLFTVILNLAQQGLIDWWMEGRTLIVRKPDVAFTDRSAAIVVRAHLLEDGPNELDAGNLIHKVLVIGEGRAQLVASQVAGADAPWGQEFVGIQQGGINDPGLMQLFADKELGSAFRQTAQYTRTLLAENPDAPTPLVDFQVGDWITAPNADGQLEKLRVFEVDINVDGEGKLTAVLTLNDRIIDQSIRTARRVSGIVGGSTASGGTGAVPGYNDKRVPKAPTGVTAGADAYIDNDGRVRAIAQVAWTPVTLATDNSSLTISEYRVELNHNSAGWAQVATVTDTLYTQGGFYPGASALWRITAVGQNGQVSARSAVATIASMPGDAVPPPQPSAPVVVDSFGALVIKWDGKTYDNAPMPKDFTEVRVYMGTTSGFTPSAANLINTLRTAGEIAKGDIPYSVQRWFKFVAVDSTGNASPASVAVVGSITPPLQNIDAANLIDYSIDAGTKVAAGTIDTTRLRVAPSNMITDSVFSDANLNAIRVAASGSPVVTAEGPTTTYPAGRLYYTATAAQRWVYFSLPNSSIYNALPIEAGKIYHLSVNVASTQTVSALAFALYYTRADGTTGSAAVILDAASVTPTGTTFTGTWTAPTTAVRGGMGVRMTTLAGAVVTITKPYMQVKSSGVLIEDGTVFANQLAANSVTAGKIAAGAVTATAISATAIDGKTITGARIQTAATGARVLMNTNGVHQLDDAGVVISSFQPTAWYFRSATSGARTEVRNTGIYVYNDAGQSTFQALASNGSLQIAGTFRTNPAGVFPRTEIANTNHPGNMFGINFYTDTGQSSYPSMRAVYQGAVGSWLQNALVLTSGSGSSPTQLLLNTNGGINLTDGSAGFYLTNGRPSVQGYFSIATISTSTASANLNRVGDTEIRVTTSLRRFKLDREEVPLDYRVLGLKPMTWRDAGEVERDSSTTRRYAGFVAEDVQDLSVAAGGVFDSLLSTDDQGGLQGVQYDRIPAFLIPVIRDMADRITTLENLLEA